MSSTPEDGEVEQHAVEEELYSADLPDETLPLKNTDDAPIHRDTDFLEEDVDTIPQLDPEDPENLKDSVEPTGEEQDLHDVAHLQPATQSGNGVSPAPASLDGSASIPDDTLSLQDSGVSSPKSDTQLPPVTVSRNSSTASRRPFELRFQSRLSTSYLGTPRAASPAFLGQHSRHSSLASFGRDSESGFEETATPWEVIRWNRLRKLTGQSFSEAGRRNFGSPTCLAVTDQIVVGTSKGLVLVFDHHQNNKAIIGAGTKAAESGKVTALAISADHTAIAVGHASGNIFTWELSRPGRPFLHIAAVDGAQSVARKADGHLQGSAVLHIGFLGYRRTALVSADDKGMAFSHLASRGTGALGRTVKTTRILGRYPELIVRKTDKPIKKSSVLAFSPLPLGNVEQSTDNIGLVALLTPYLLVIVSTTPIAQTQHKAARPKDVAAHSAMTAALAWFPAIKLKGGEAEVSRNKLVYAWSNVLSVLDVVEVPKEPDAPEDKPIELQFLVRNRYQAEEAIVAVQWLSRSIMAVLTITQQLLIIEDVSMNVTDAFDLLPKNLYHVDLYSHQLQSVIEHHDDEDTSLHGVVADAYYMSFRGYKGRLFLLGFNDMWWGSLTNWADRLLALMEAGDFIGAIRLATTYYSGSGEKLTVGLPEDDAMRSSLVREKLVEMMSASLRYAFGKNQQADQQSLGRQQLLDLAVACVAACLRMDDKDYLFNELFDWYDENGVGDIVIDVLEPHILDRQITALPPAAVKTLINHFSETHAPSQLEEIICLLDATAMDVDQVTHLCKQHNLYDAYIYVWNTALMDYSSPLLELVAMASRDPQPNGNIAAPTSQRTTAQKMFPYLSFVLTSRAYPVGEFMDEGRAFTAKSQIYETLFYGTGGEGDPFAILRAILAFDTPSFMTAMNEAFEDPFLNSNLNPEAEGTHRSPAFSRQMIIDILLKVMSTGSSHDDHLYLDMFIARSLPKYPQYMLLSGTTMEQVFTRLCQYGDENLKDDAELSLEYLMTVYKPTNATTFLPLLKHAKFFRVLKSVYRRELAWTDLFEVYLVSSENQNSIFDLMVECLGEHSDLSTEQRRNLVDAVKNHCEELAKIDIIQTAKVIDVVLPQEHGFVLQTLREDHRSQFYYLRALFEPEQGLRKSYHTSSFMLERYVGLMCQYDPHHVVEYVKALQDGDLHLEEVIPALESSGNIDAAVILYAKQGQIQIAMNRLVQHLSAIEAALVGVLETAHDSPDEVATNEAIEDLLRSIDKYATVGLWLCETQTRQLQIRGKASKTSRRTSLQQPLSFEENLWLDFTLSVVSIVQNAGPAPAKLGYQTENDELAKGLRATVQRIFTALLNSTASAREQGQQSDTLQFVRILRAFLSRAAEQSPSLSHLRHVMASIFSAYAYEESLLALSNTMLDKDLFVQVDEVTRLRQMGWRPRGQVCGVCRRRVWGPGAGFKIWEHWQKREKARSKRKDLHRRRSAASLSMGGEDDEHDVIGKGKSVANQIGADDTDEELTKHDGAAAKARDADLGPVVVFSCRHLFHKRCLDQSQDPDLEEGGMMVPHGAADAYPGTKLACPTCE